LASNGNLVDAARCEIARTAASARSNAAKVNRIAIWEVRRERAMIVRTLDQITDTDRDVKGGGEPWRAKRLFLRDDGLGFSLSETTVEGGAELNIWYKHHQEACFVIEGSAEITERDTGVVHRIGPGSGYAPQHDRHTIRVLEPLRLVCVFAPALTGQETHDPDGSYLPATD
jgi:L-ectoine synthase